MSFKLQLDADGDIEVIPDQICRDNLTIGDYIFRATLIKVPNEYESERHLAYKIIAKFDDRVIEVNGERIDFSENTQKNSFRDLNLKIFIICVIVTLLIILNFILFRKKNK